MIPPELESSTPVDVKSEEEKEAQPSSDRRDRKDKKNNQSVDSGELDDEQKKEREKLEAAQLKTEQEEEYARYKLKSLWKLKAKMDYQKTAKTRSIFPGIKELFLVQLSRIESLLITIDKKMFDDRNNLVTLLKYVGGGIEHRENSIKD